MEKVVAKTLTFVTTSLWSGSSPEAVFLKSWGQVWRPRVSGPQPASSALELPPRELALGCSRASRPCSPGFCFFTARRSLCVEVGLCTPPGSAEEVMIALTRESAKVNESNSKPDVSENLSSLKKASDTGLCGVAFGSSPQDSCKFWPGLICP